MTELKKNYIFTNPVVVVPIDGIKIFISEPPPAEEVVIYTGPGGMVTAKNTKISTSTFLNGFYG